MKHKQKYGGRVGKEAPEPVYPVPVIPVVFPSTVTYVGELLIPIPVVFPLTYTLAYPVCAETVVPPGAAPAAL